MFRSRLMSSLFVLVLLLPGLALGFSSGKKAPVLPDDLVRLLPTEIHMLAATTSLGELDAKLIYLSEDLETPETDGFSVLVELVKMLDSCPDCVDLEQPLAVVFTIPSLMGGGEPLVTLILPWRTDAPPIATVVETSPFNASAESNGYVALSTDPYYEPAETVPELAVDFPLSLDTGRLDLAALIEMARPMAEMGLGAMIMNAGQQADNTGAAGPNPVGQMSVAEAQALADLLRGTMDSLQRLEWTVVEKDQELTLTAEFMVFPDSPLSPVPQPSLKSAIEMTRFLTSEADFTYVSAADKIKQFDLFMNYYRENLKREMSNLDPDTGAQFEAWFEAYMDVMPVFYFQPQAGSLSLDPEGWRINYIIESEDTAADLERISLLMDSYPGFPGIMIQPQPAPADGIKYWKIDFDPEAMSDPGDDIPAPTQAPEPGNMTQLSLVLSKVMPGIYLTATDDYLLGTVAETHYDLLALVEATTQRRSAVEPGIARAAKDAGPDCQQVIIGDVRSLLVWIKDLLMELDPDTKIDWADDEPLPFVQTVNIDSQSYGVTWKTSEAALKALIGDLRKIER